MFSQIRIILPLVVITAVLGAIWLNLRRSNSSSPRAMFAVVQRRIGQLEIENAATVSFPIVNKGQRELRILRVETTCGCLTASFPDQLPPGKGGEITLRFEALAGWSGRVSKQIAVYTNDPLCAPTMLEVVADIDPLLRIEPADFHRQEVRRGDTLHHQFRLIPRDGVSFEVTAAVPLQEFVNARLTSAAEQGRRSWLLDVDLGPVRGMAGELQGSVEILTTHRKMRKRTISVTATVVEGTTVSPSEVILGRVSPGREGDEIATLRIVTHGKEKVRVLSVKSLTPGIAGEAAPEYDTHQARVILRRTRSLAVGRIQGTVEIHTDADTGLAFSVPIELTVQ